MATLTRLVRAERMAALVAARQTDRLATFRADPATLMRAAGFDPDPWQVELMRSDPARDLLVIAGRQVGKSTGCGFLAVKEAYLTPGSTTVIVSPTLRQSSEMLLKVKGAMNALGRPVPVAAESASAVALVNGSRVVSLPGSEATIRGYSATLAIVDEGARVPDTLLGAVRPMLAATGGRFAAVSSAFAKSGWLYDLWERGGPGFVRLSVKSSECPRISAEHLRQERAILGPTLYACEYDNCWLSGTSSVFDAELVRAAFTDAVTPLYGAKAEIATAPWQLPPSAAKPLFGAA